MHQRDDKLYFNKIDKDEVVDKVPKRSTTHISKHHNHVLTSTTEVHKQTH